MAIGVSSRMGTANPPKIGIQKRIPWTTSRITGSPDPPLPYVTQRAFPALKFNQCLDITTAPGSDRLFVVEQSGKIYSFPNKADVPTADLVVDFAKENSDIKQVYANILITLDRAEFIPVIAPIGRGEKGETLNINADFVASKIAGALKAEKLLLMTDIDGVKGKNGKLITGLTRKDAQKLIKSKIIKDGMLPKVNCCLDALKEGVAKTHIVDGRVKHALLLEMFTEAGVGTQIIEK